jgi:hypothetical protein
VILCLEEVIPAPLLSAYTSSMNIENTSTAAEPKALSKRTVALHVAYVGTGYKGNNILLIEKYLLHEKM